MNTMTRRLMPAALILAALGVGFQVMNAHSLVAPIDVQAAVVLMPQVMVTASREAMLAQELPVIQLPMVVVTGRRDAFDELKLAQARSAARRPG